MLYAFDHFDEEPRDMRKLRAKAREAIAVIIIGICIFAIGAGVSIRISAQPNEAFSERLQETQRQLAEAKIQVATNSSEITLLRTDVARLSGAVSSIEGIGIGCSIVMGFLQILQLFVGRKDQD